MSESRKEYEKKVGREIHLGIHSDLLNYKNYLEDQLSQYKVKLAECLEFISGLSNGTDSNYYKGNKLDNVVSKEHFFYMKFPEYKASNESNTST